MKQKNKEIRPEMKYDVMDVCDMKSYTDEKFDLVFDKSTMDALVCGTDSDTSISKMLKEVRRVLKIGGYYVSITFDSPDHRIKYFNNSQLGF